MKTQRLRLEQATIRLRQRDNTLFQECVAEIKKNRRDRAGIRACELAEVRKLLYMVNQCQLALERIILRLETIKEVSEIMADLKPALTSLRVLTENLGNVMPDVARELENVNESISETLAMTHLNTPESIAPLTSKTEAGEQILNEVSDFLEDKLSEQLPTPPVIAQPARTEAKTEKVSTKKQMIALSATCSEIMQPEDAQEEEGARKPEPVVTYKNVKVREVSYTVQKQPHLEDAILEYAKNTGEIDVDQCAHELSVPQVEIEEALENLGKKRKIMIQR